MNTIPNPKDPFADLDDREFDAISSMDANELKAYEQRKAAHISNGGEATFPCPACHGSGRWGYSGRPCFKCKSTGKVSKSVNAAAKAVVTRKLNFDAWVAENQELIDGMKRHLWHNFIRSMYEQVTIDLRRLSENQVLAVTDAVARYDLKEQVRKELLEKANAANSGEIDLSAIDKLFATAKSNGLKKPIWRAQGLEIRTDRQYGCDDLWIKEPAKDGYVGKIVNGHFKAFRRADENTLPTLKEIAANPLQAAINYGQATNRCSCCNRSLIAGVSVVSGIGPICAGKWGLDAWRDEAQDMIARGEA